MLLILILINSIGFAQKKKPTRSTVVPQDTTLTVQKKPNPEKATDPGLPTIELKNIQLLVKELSLMSLLLKRQPIKLMYQL